MSLEKAIEYAEKRKSENNPVKKAFYWVAERVEFPFWKVENRIEIELLKAKIAYITGDNKLEEETSKNIKYLARRVGGIKSVSYMADMIETQIEGIKYSLNNM